MNTTLPFRSVSIDIPVTGVTETDREGNIFTVEFVHFTAYIATDGRFEYQAFAHGAPGEVTSTPGTWLPTPPLEFSRLADALRKSVES